MEDRKKARTTVPETVSIRSAIRQVIREPVSRSGYFQTAARSYKRS